MGNLFRGQKYNFQEPFGSIGFWGTKRVNREEILKVLKEVKDEVRQRYMAEVEGLFGSFARDEEGIQSDVDILVKFKEGANLLHLVGLSLFLEEKLRFSVDIVPLDSLREEIRDEVLKEAIYL
ncbi:nucleotidyltransferase family protein [Thermodesulfovibrionales bacterium]|nr:nucleotidyltransferase family protein [Thermodesulfovibrionales bacterium]